MERRTFTVRLTVNAKERLEEFCATQGVTMTGMLEAFTLMIPSATEERLAELVQLAREVDRQHRSRSDRDRER